MTDDVPQGTELDGEREPEEIRARRRAALAQQLHAVIRHGQTPRRASIDRAICVIDELARAVKITKRVWVDAIASSVAIGRHRTRVTRD